MRIYKIIKWSLAVCLFLTISGEVRGFDKRDILQTVEINDCKMTYEVLSESKKTAALVQVELSGDTLIIPSKIAGYKITDIGGEERKLEDFSSKFPIINRRGENVRETLKKLEIPESVEYITKGAFVGAAIESVEFKNPKIEIDDRAFAGCVNLKKVIWPKKQMVGQIGTRCFANTGIEQLNLPNVKNSNQFSKNCFSNMYHLKRIICPKKNKVIISKLMLEECEEVTIVVPKGVKKFEFHSLRRMKKIIFLDKQTKFVNLDVLETDGVKWKGEYFLQVERVVALKGAKILKQLDTACYGKSQYEYGQEGDGFDFSYKATEIHKVKTRSVSQPTVPKLSLANRKVTWKKCKKATSYEVYFSKAKNGPYKKVASTKKCKYSTKKAGYIKVRAVRTKFNVDWKGNFSKPCKIK